MTVRLRPLHSGQTDSGSAGVEPQFPAGIAPGGFLRSARRTGVRLSAHGVVRDGLRWLFESAAGIQVVGEAGDGETAVRLAAELAPDVVLMDLAMPGMDGAEATRRVKAASPGTCILVLTMSDSDASLLAAVSAGASGYVLKGTSQEDLLRATRAVADGQALFGTGVARRVLAMVKAVHPAGKVFPELTTREREVLELMARGQRNAEIAHRLRLSEKTVRNNVSTILTKLHASDRAQAVARARDAGLGAHDPPETHMT